ncbi:uncharacterized protein LOC135483778 [Lineus longissimus]|uniref:uncharacterized protein LOC135483778 n=1 Tax=Lineus longissimus TaxID=88925 RepID=UPI00315D7A08
MRATMKPVIINIITIIILSLTSSSLLECLDGKGGNLAIGKPASQSSDYRQGEADHAVDGNPNPSQADSQSCTQTKEESSPWWFVDLKSQYRVKNIIIINRSDNWGGRLKDFHVTITDVKPPDGFSSGKVCYNQHDAANDGQKFNISCYDQVGRFVGVGLRSIGILSLCEVEVYGKKLGDYVYDAIPVSQELKPVATKPARSPIECSLWCLGCLNCLEFSFANGECRMYGKDVIAGTPSVTKRYKKMWLVSRCVNTELLFVHTVITHPKSIAVKLVCRSSLVNYLLASPECVCGALPTLTLIMRATMKPVIIIIITIIILSLTSSGLLECLDEKGPNVARGKPVSQSTTLPGAEAGKAVDGNRNPSRYQAGSCSHTIKNHPSPPWWFVDLKERHFVRNVTIINRSDTFGYRLRDFDVIITEVVPPGGFSSGQVCYSHQGVAADGQIFDLQCHGEVGRFVGVRLRAEGVLCLCEVEIFGRSLAYVYDAIPVSQELKLVATKPSMSLSECSLWCLGCLDCYEFSYANEECRMYGKDVIAGTPSVTKRYKKMW